MTNPIAERKKRRLNAKPPTYNENCAGCKERAFDIMKALDAVDENIDTVEEIFDMLDSAEERLVKLEEELKVQGQLINAVDKDAEESIKRLANDIAGLQTLIASLRTDFKNELKPIKEDLDSATEFIKFLKKTRRIIGALFGISSVIFAIIGALPKQFWEWVFKIFFGG